MKTQQEMARDTVEVLKRLEQKKQDPTRAQDKIKSTMFAYHRC